MINVGIIVPTWHYFDDPLKLQPLHELYYATVLEHLYKDKINVEVIDLRQIRQLHADISYETVCNLTPQCDIYFYWIMKTADYDEIITIKKYLLEKYPNSKHIAGGTHIQSTYQEEEFDFDSIIIGAGEQPLLDAVTRLSKKQEFLKVYDGGWSNTTLEDYPYPLRYYLPKKAIVNKSLFLKYEQTLGTSTLFSRGCPLRCTFCVYNIPREVHYRSKNTIKEEIQYLKSVYRVKAINLRDENCIPLNKTVAKYFMEALGESNIIWRGQTSVIADEPMVKLAADSGCKELSIGVESASLRVREIIKKPLSKEKIKVMIDSCHKYNIKVKMCLIFGLPGEPQNIYDNTIQFIKYMEPDYVAVSGLCPVPGSAIYKNAEEHGISYIDKNWEKHAHLMGRFSNSEEHGLPFEYNQRNKWGKTLTRDQIANNVFSLQNYLREKDMIY